MPGRGASSRRGVRGGARLDRRDPPEVERVAEADGCGIAAATPEPGPSGQAVESACTRHRRSAAYQPCPPPSRQTARKTAAGVASISVSRQSAKTRPPAQSGSPGMAPASLQRVSRSRSTSFPSAARTASRTSRRRPGISRVARRADATELRSPSASGRAMAAESGVTGVDPERAQSRGEHRHWEDPAPAQAELVGHEVEDLAVGEDFGPPMSIVSPLVAGVAGASTRCAQRVLDGDRLAARRHPPRRDHDGQSLDQVAQDLERGRARSDDHRGAQRRHRDPGCGELLLHLAPRAQMLGQAVPGLTEPAEIKRMRPMPAAAAARPNDAARSRSRAA